MSVRGLALYAAFSDYPGTRHNQRDGNRSENVVTSRATERKSLGMRLHKLGSAVAASASVFVKLLGRPAGGTTVVLVPREQIPDASSAVVVSEDYELLPRAS
jgi:hypothetical protein